MPRFKEIRREVIECLLESNRRQRTEITRTLVLPDIEPEDLTGPPPMLGGRRRPIRRREIKRETVEI